MSEVIIPYIAESKAVLREISAPRSACCKICEQRGYQHNSYAATQGLLLQNR